MALAPQQPPKGANDQVAPKAQAAAPAKQPAPRGRKRRDGAVVGYLSGVLTFLTLIAIAIAGVVYWGKSEFDRPGPLGEPATVMITRNQGVGEIADNLARAGVISDANVFKAGVGAYGAKDRLRFGEYVFPANVSMRETMEIIVSGKSIEHTVTIPKA